MVRETFWQDVLVGIVRRVRNVHERVGALATSTDKSLRIGSPFMRVIDWVAMNLCGNMDVSIVGPYL